jgi:hypothetical protein
VYRDITSTILSARNKSCLKPKLDSVDLSRKLISRLYDPKGKWKRCHIDLSKLRVKLETVKDSLKGQERPYLGISQRCDLERYSLDTVCQNTVHAKLCGIRLFLCACQAPVHDLCKSLSSVVCEILPADHALTGCDTTSSFFGIEKNSMFKVLKEPPNQFSDLSRIE